MIRYDYIKGIFGALRELDMTDDDRYMLVRQFSGGRTASLKELHPEELKALLQTLNQERLKRTKKMRAKVVHYLCLMGYTRPDGRPDLDRINGFVQKRCGNANPKRKPLHFLSPAECRKVVTIVEQMYRKHTLQK
ncbi:MAG: hypothetical protein D6751_05490 [Deltaproteobacteria bacterium]|nr:MAG: hypothetical protein D6751_05490 [Deltaproteobacteria bacterium]